MILLSLVSRRALSFAKHGTALSSSSVINTLPISEERSDRIHRRLNTDERVCIYFLQNFLENFPQISNLLHC